MKKISLFFIGFLFIFNNLTAQYRNDEHNTGLKKENVFVGGSVALGYGGGNNTSSFVIGGNPEIGYSVADWMDVGIAFNCIFNSYKYFENIYNYKQNAFNYGAGIFTRLHVFNSFFLQAQPEFNWISYHQKNIDLGIKYPKITTKASSFLAGVGFGQRIIGQSSFYTIIMFDLGSERYSPYRDNYGTAVPIIRGGFNIYLHTNKKKKK